MNHQTLPHDALFDRDRLAQFNQIAVLRALEGLGDFLCLVPALRSLRAAVPQAKITLVGLTKMQALVQRFHHYVDELLIVPGYPGLPEQKPQLRQLPGFFTETQDRCFDLALQLHGSGLITNPLMMLMGAKRNAGFFLPGQYCPEPDSFLPYPVDESEIRCYLQLLAFLGFPAQGEAMEFPIHESDEQALQAIAATHPLPTQPYVCIHPGASNADRRWAPDHFATIAHTLASWGFQIVLTGSSDEMPVTQAVASLMRSPSLNLAGCTNLGALAVLLKGARLVICNDTGVSHLAAALQVPSVVIFTASDPKRWAPLDRRQHRVICANRGESVSNAITQAAALLERSMTARTPASRLSLAAQDGVPV